MTARRGDNRVFHEIYSFTTGYSTFRRSLVAFYKIAFIHFAVALVASAVLLVRRFVVSRNTVARQQLKWVVWGSALAITPFTLLYATGYILTETANPLSDAALVPLVLIPLSLGYSVVRYRVMELSWLCVAPPSMLHDLGDRRGDRGHRLFAGMHWRDVGSTGQITLRLISFRDRDGLHSHMLRR